MYKGNTSSCGCLRNGGVGGGIGGVIVAMTNGFKRGVFSNEAGLGSSVMVHSNSSVKEPVKQGMWGIFEVFADTMVVCTMTALVVISVLYAGNGPLADGAEDGITKANMMQLAFGEVFGTAAGNILVAIFR